MTSYAVDTPITLEPVAPPPRPRRVMRVVTTSLVVALAGCVGWYLVSKRAEATRMSDVSQPPPGKPSEAISVEVVKPTTGGIERICIQPGSIEPFEAADLYSKVSGFLFEQSVDIGSRVKAGQVLAKIAVPEFEKQVERDAAKVQHAEAVVKQVQARIVAAEAEAKSAEVSVSVAKTQAKAKGAYRRFREKQLTRFKELNAQRAIDAKVVDESEDQFEAAVEAENAAKEAVAAADQRLIASRARIDQSRADLDEARAEVKVAVAELERARVLVAYSVIKSPYDGVVTKRSFSPGDFVRSADVGGDRVPLLAIERTDKMRVVVQVPDRDVPYTDIGDEAIVEIDALPEKNFKAVIARVAESEDATTRTMRTEIDLPNTDGKLRRGMYGRVTIRLERGHPASVTVPSSTLSNHSTGNRATVMVAQDGFARFRPVIVGVDNGIRVEVLSGLGPKDSVIIRASGPLEDGTRVEEAGAKAGR